jgi:hypothetical protein
MKNLYSKIIAKIIFLTLVTSMVAMAQQYFPVAAKVIQTPPYPIYLSDLSNPAQQRLAVNVQLKDNKLSSRPIRLKFYMEGNGFNISSVDVVQGEQPIVLTLGQIYQIPANQVANYFNVYNLKISNEQYQRPFKEGRFRFGIEIIDVATSRPISGIQWANDIWLTVNEPPIWVFPTVNTKFITPTFPQNVIFNWAPRHKNVSDVEYEFTMTEILVNNGFNGNVQNLFLSQPAFYKTVTKSTSVNYNTTLPPLIPGRTYAYRVQAIAKQGLNAIGLFRNNGFSEIQYFTYGIQTEAPEIKLTKWTDELNQASISWLGKTNQIEYDLAYREKGVGANWITERVPKASNDLNYLKFLSNLNPRKTYEFKVTGKYDTNQSATSDLNTLNNLSEEEITKREEKIFKLSGKVNWAFRVGEADVPGAGNLSASTKEERKITSITELSTPDSRRFVLPKATVKLCYSASVLNLNNVNLIANISKLKVIETVATNETGEFKFDAIKFQLSIDKNKKYYLYTSYTNKVFDDVIVPITLNASGNLNIAVNDIVLPANTFRFSPKIVFPTGSSEQNLEHVSVYRLKSVMDKHAFLLNEIRAKDTEEVTFNGAAYTKLASYITNKFFTQLFYNDVFNDNLIIGIKEKNRSIVFYPITRVTDPGQQKLSAVEDYFNYTTPNIIVSGLVATGNRAFFAPISNSSVNFVKAKPGEKVIVTLFGQKPTPKQGISTVSDSRGLYSTIFSPTAEAGYYESSASYKGNFQYQSINYNQVDLRHDFYFDAMAYGIYGIVRDKKGDPFSGAIVLSGSGSVKTDENGFFALSVVEDPSQNITILADGHEPKILAISDFTSFILIPDAADINADVRKTNVNRSNWENALKNSDSYAKMIAYDAASVWDNTRMSSAYNTNFRDKKVLVKNIYDNSNIQLFDKLRPLHIKTYTKEGTKKTYVSSQIVVNGESLSIPLQGYTRETEDRSFSFAQKTIEDNQLGYIFTAFEKDAPYNLGLKDSIKFEIEVQEAFLLSATLQDSTKYLDTTNKALGYQFVADAEVEIEGLKFKAKTGADGKFSILIKKGKEDNISFFKQGYQLTTFVLPANLALIKNKKTYYIKTIDEDFPKFEKFMGFKIVMESARVDKGGPSTGLAKQETKAFAISGRLEIPDDGIFKGVSVSYFNFKEVPVKVDPTDKSNAVLIDPFLLFDETVVQGTVFDYAKVNLTGTANKEQPFRLIPIQSGSGFGKIEVQNILFNEEKIMGQDVKLKIGNVSLKYVKSDSKGFDFNNGLNERNQQVVDLQNKIDNNPVIDKTKPASLDPDRYDVFISPGKNIASLNPKTKFKFDVAKRTYSGAGPGYTAKDSLEKYFYFSVGKGVIPFGTMQIEREKAVISKTGINMNGYYKFPLMKRFGIIDPPIIESLLVGKDMEMARLAFMKPGKKPIATFNTSGKYKLEVDKLIVYKGFTGFGLGGKIYTDVDNYMIVNSFEIIKYASLDYPVPGLEISFPANGFKIGKLNLKSPKGSIIRFYYNEKDSSYDVDGGVIMAINPKSVPEVEEDDLSDVEWVKNPLIDEEDDGVVWQKNPLYKPDPNFGKEEDDGIEWQNNPLYKPDPNFETKASLAPEEVANPADAKNVSDVFPIEAQRFIIGTDGKFFLSLKANWWVNIGPAKINVRRLLFSKGSSVSWSEMLGYLNKTEDELKAFSSTSTFNNSNSQLFTDKNQAQRKVDLGGSVGVNYLNPDVTLDVSTATWAFGFAGGVQFENLKGINAKADASFLIGDKGNGVEVSFNSIDIVMESTAYRGKASIRIVNTAAKSGFEGSGEIETIASKFSASVKFYKITGGVEFGASLVASTRIMTGPVTWSAIGGLVEFNTVKKTFKVGFLGAAYLSASTPEVNEFRNISVIVEFDTKKCGALPVITGKADWYLKKEEYCNLKVVLDMCKLTLLGDINCNKQIIGATVNMKATAFFTTKSVFLGASIRTNMFKMSLNGTIVLGVNSNFNVAPPEVRYYKQYIADLMLTNNKSTLDGIYIGLSFSYTGSTNGNLSIGPINLCTYSFSAYANGKFDLGYSWGNGNFIGAVALNGGLGANLWISSYHLVGQADFGLALRLQRVNSVWSGSGSVSVNMSLAGGGGDRYRCNTGNIKWCSYNTRLPCGLSCCCGRWWTPRVPRCSLKWCNVAIPYPCGLAFKGCFSFNKSFSY